MLAQAPPSRMPPPVPTSYRRQALVEMARTLKERSVQPLSLIGIMWIVEFFDYLTGGRLDYYGIEPRAWSGLWGILWAPFLHGSFEHLAANTVPFVILGTLVSIGGRKLFQAVTLFVLLFGGLAVWLFSGAYSVHIGASGLIFGYLGFLIARGFLERSAITLGVAFGILFFYGSLLFGVLPLQAGVSWQSHLFGFLAGVAAAKIREDDRRTRRRW